MLRCAQHDRPFLPQPGSHAKGLEMSSTGIRFAGFGGQGVIMAGMIVGRAACIYDSKNATLIQSFGPEARGSACSAQLIISPEPILYPYLDYSDILVALSQEAYVRFVPALKPEGTLILEEDLVKPISNGHAERAYAIPATRIAEQVGRKLVLNVVMVGFTAAITGVISADAARQAIRDSVPQGTESLNLEAFEKGLSFGLGVACSGR